MIRDCSYPLDYAFRSFEKRTVSPLEEAYEDLHPNDDSRAAERRPTSLDTGWGRHRNYE